MNKNMNSYELIETYPGSPGLGTIVVDTNINNGAKDGYFSENWGKPNGGSAFKISIQHDCENNPKFWRKIENKKLLTKDTVKEGQKVYRIWRNGEKSLGVITKPDFMMFEALEDYPAEGQITKGYRYGLGDYKYELIEEVIKKDYEILEIHYKSDNEDTIVEYLNGIAVKRNDNISIEDTCTLKQFNKTDWEKYITITKVKRLSNNQIFKLGDLISDGNQEGKILRLRVTNDGLFQFSCSEKNGWCEFDNYNIIIKKDYEILSLARICSIKPTITDVSDYGDEFIKALLKCDNTIIHSVKRLSDGEI
jgi:hypothetical protein